MKRFLYVVALCLGVFTAIAYVIGKDREEEADIKLSEMSQSQKVAHLKERARQADSKAQYLLGEFYERERQDYLKAYSWYRAAASRGQHAGAMYKLGYLFLNGRGVENNMATAMDWFRKAAQMGEPRAQYFLGISIRDGWERKPDFIEAYKWIWLSQRGAEQLKAEDERHDPKQALEQMTAQMSDFKKQRALEEAQKWLRQKGLAN